MRVGLRIGRVGEAVLLCLLAYLEGGASPLVVRQKVVLQALVRRLGNLDRSNARRAIERLKSNGLVIATRRSLKLSAAGKKHALRRCLGIEVISVAKKWDGRWRLVAFDVPEARRLERDILRNALSAIGFAPIQKSVWAHPCASERQVAKTVARLGADRYVSYILADRINDDRALRKRFGI